MTKYRIVHDSDYAPCGFLLQRTRNDVFEEYRDFLNPNATVDTVLFDSDWTLPALACSLGWNGCPHGSDGTVACKECGKSASDFISEADTFLRNMDTPVDFPILAEHFKD